MSHLQAARPVALLGSPAALQLRRAATGVARDAPAASKMLARRGRLRRTGSPPAAAPGDAPLGDAAMRADDMLRGELLSTLMQRRVMMAEQQQQGPAALQAAAAPEPAAPQMSAELAGGVPLPESAAAAAVAAASAATDVPAQPRGRGRPRKHSPEAAAPAAPGSAPAVAGAADGAVAAGGCGAAAALAAYEDALARATLASVSFCLKAQLEYGQRVRVVGGIQELGDWNVAEAPELQWTKGDKWQVTVQMPAGCVAEYKYVVLHADGRTAAAWQPGANNVLALRSQEEAVTVQDTWSCDPDSALVVSGGGPAERREDRLPAWAGEMQVQLAAQRSELRRARLELMGSQQALREARERDEWNRSQAAAREAEIHAEYGARELELRAEYKAREVELRQVAMESEAARAEAAAALTEARGVNQAMQAQLTETTAALHDAIETAGQLLAEIEQQAVADGMVSDSEPSATEQPAPRRRGRRKAA